MANDLPKAGVTTLLIIGVIVIGWWLQKQVDSPAYHTSVSEWWSSPSPIRTVDAPKAISADGVLFTACVGEVLVFSPSREIVASSGEGKSYEIAFYDDFGQPQDLKDIRTFEITDAPEATYALGPQANETNTSTTYSNGTPIAVGDTVFFNQGKSGRARWEGAGKWKPVPCKSD